MKTSATQQLFRFIVLCAALFGSFGSAQQATQVESAELFNGSWQGAIDVPGAPLEIIVRLSFEAEGARGTIDIPAQGASGLPLENVEAEGKNVLFSIASTPGNPTFHGQLGEGEITGEFTQSGQEFPFKLVRTTETSGATAAPEIYEDPLGSFTVPIPARWQATAEDDYVRLSSPDDGILVYVITSEDSDLEAAIASGWQLVDPDLNLEPAETLQLPSDPGVEQTTLVRYDVSDRDQVHEAVAQLHDGTAYTLLIDGKLADVQRLNAQLQIVLTGFTISALDSTDLSGLTPLAVENISAQLDAFISESLQAFGLPGAAVAIVQDGDIVFSEGYGVKEAGGDEPVTPSTQMMIGSTGKTMTAMLMAILVDDGIVEWDTPVIDVLPEFAVADPELTKEITLRHLLCACIGVPRRDFELFFNSDELTAEGIIESLRTFEFFTDFGEVFQYSNQLVGAAGYAAAAADGATYGNLLEGYVDSLQHRVLDPIDMSATTLSFQEIEERGEHGNPHQLNIETGNYEPINLDLEKSLLSIAPAGAHWSTAEDMSRYLLTQLDEGVVPNGKRVVSEENLHVTWQPQVQMTANDSYGLGWIVTDYYGLTMLSHGGNTLGFTSEFIFSPDSGVGIVVLTNGQSANNFTRSVATRLYELIYDQPADTEAQVEFAVAQTAQALKEAQEQVLERVGPEAIEPYLGTWHDAALGTITLKLDGDQLIMDAGELKSEIRPIVDRKGEFDGYITYGPPLAGLPVQFREDEEGQQSIVLGEGAVSYTFERAQ